MNLREFTALKAGDKIENAMSNSRGEVVDADARGVSVRWHGVGQNGAGTIRHYSAQSTLWFHWTFAPQDAASNVDPGLDQAISEELANSPAPIMRDTP